MPSCCITAHTEQPEDPDDAPADANSSCPPTVRQMAACRYHSQSKLQQAMLFLLDRTCNLHKEFRACNIKMKGHNSTCTRKTFIIFLNPSSSHKVNDSLLQSSFAFC